MTSQQILDYCMNKNGAYIDYPFGPDVIIVKVKASQGAGHIFTQLFTLKGQPCATFNCDTMTGEFYRSIYPDTVIRGYHCPRVMQPYFNTVRLNGDLPDEEILRMIDHSYIVVVDKLPKYAQKELREQNNIF